MRRRVPPSVNVLCFLLTLASTSIVGTLLRLSDFSWPTIRDIVLTPSFWPIGFSYSLPVLMILGAHEMGHYVACRRYGVEATLPFFIPFPNILGTMGAVIRIRTPFTGRRALFDIGVAGPIAGFVVAMPVLAYGVAHSRIVANVPQHDITFPNCLALELALRHFLHDLPPGGVVYRHPAVVAAWVGCLATFLNLLPIGQLDGGHMLFAFSPRLHRAISFAAIVGLIACGFLYDGWHLVAFGAVWAVIGTRHPRVPEEPGGLGLFRILIAVAAMLIFVLCFIAGAPEFP